MSKRLKIYLSGFLLVLGLLMYTEYTKPKPINWTPSYSVKDKIPFGTYVMSKEITKLFPDKEVTFVSKTPFSFLSDYEKENSTYFIISSNLSRADENALLSFVKKGNDVFIASENMPKGILDTLNLEVDKTYYVLKQDFSSIRLYLNNPVFENQKYSFKKVNTYFYFNKLDSTHSQILGQYSTKTEKKTNFIKQKYGNGYFYLQLFSKEYTNYFMLDNSTFTYAVNSLNYIDKKHILWDENNKSVHTSADGIMKYIFNNPPLHWAWIILIVSTLVYCLFFGKRLQRIIPIIKPLHNATVDFTKTIGNLYFNDNNPKDIIHKKIKYFLFFIKKHYLIDIERIDNEFSKNLSLKSGVSKEITDEIVSLILKYKNNGSCTNKDLENINKIIDSFYKKIK